MLPVRRVKYAVQRTTLAYAVFMLTTVYAHNFCFFNVKAIHMRWVRSQSHDERRQSVKMKNTSKDPLNEEIHS